MSVNNYFSCGLFVVLLSLLIFPIMFSLGLCGIGSIMVSSNYFVFDSLFFYLLFLVVFLGLYIILYMNSFLGGGTIFFLMLSLLFSCLCFCVNHCVIFWGFYELSMLPLLYLIFRDSPYSERFIAGWYFSAYLTVTSLPLVLILLYLSYVNESLFMSSWDLGHASLFIYLVLAFLFFTKVPLSPFHTWLPIVHAEATSIVSIFLSGYIMKLGLLGVYRCAPFIFNNSFLFYFFVCGACSVFFLVTASIELDGKRWLAFLSLSHIVVPFLAFFVCSNVNISLSFLYCLGHGLSAGLLFGILWFFYDVTNTRNWLLLKAGVTSKSIMFIVILGLLSLCSFPPTLQFFCEIGLIFQCITALYFLLFWSFYLFLGGLVPLILCGHLLIRSEGVEINDYSLYNYFFCFFLLLIWCYCGIFIL